MKEPKDTPGQSVCGLWMNPKSPENEEDFSSVAMTMNLTDT